MNDENWKEEFKQWNPDLKPFQIKLLEEGAQSQNQAFILNDMWCEWKEIKDLKEAELPSIDHSKHESSDPWT